MCGQLSRRVYFYILCGNAVFIGSIPRVMKDDGIIVVGIGCLILKLKGNITGTCSRQLKVINACNVCNICLPGDRARICPFPCGILNEFSDGRF